jgi:hypothetical protein
MNPFFADDMQLVRARVVKVVEAAAAADGDPTAVMATIFDHSPLFPAVVDATDNLAAWAGSLAVAAALLARELVDALSSDDEIAGFTLREVLREAMQLVGEPT